MSLNDAQTAPTVIVRIISEAMGLPTDLLLVNSGYLEQADTPGGIIT